MGAPFFWWRKMVALGELERYLLLFLPQHSEKTTGKIKYWYDDHSYRKSLKVAMDPPRNLNASAIE